MPDSFQVRDNVSSMDDLYKVYRKSFITRHICLNGRVDSNTWLGQVDPNNLWDGNNVTPGWISPNIRAGNEDYKEIDTGNPVQFVRVPAVGVPRTGV